MGNRPPQPAAANLLNLAIIPARGPLIYRFAVTEASCREGQIRLTSVVGRPSEIEIPGSGNYDWVLRPDGAFQSDTWLLTNQGASLLLADGQVVPEDSTCSIKLPAQIQLGSYLLDLYPALPPKPWVSGLTQLAGKRSSGERNGHRVNALGRAPSAITLAEWFDAIGRLHRAASGTEEFFDRVAEALLEPGGMDAGLVLLKDGESWKVAGARTPHPERGVPIYLDMLRAMEQSAATTFHDGESIDDGEAMTRFPLAVAAPIFDSKDQVIGAVYGLRTYHRRNHRRGIRPLEAFFVQQTGDAVTTEMIRQQQEVESARKSILLEQAFPDSLIDSLLNDPKIMEGNQRLVTVMFCDIRDFSQICERIPNEMVYQLLSQVMDLLTDRIRENTGVVIDYYGDGVAAFWNAPFDQPDHADLACVAAGQMLGDLEQFNQDWEPLLGHPLRIGIGIHTGDASVGNSGSRHRIKYGPRGRTVNLAKRIESATKHFRLPLLISRDTSTLLSETFRTRRVCYARLPGATAAIELFEPLPSVDYETRREELESYETALGSFEQGDYGACCSTLEPWLKSAGADTGVIDTLYSQSLVRRNGNFDRRRDDDSIEFIALSMNEENRV